MTAYERGGILWAIAEQMEKTRGGRKIEKERRRGWRERDSQSFTFLLFNERVISHIPSTLLLLLFLIFLV